LQNKTTYFYVIETDCLFQFCGRWWQVCALLL